MIVAMRRVCTMILLLGCNAPATATPDEQPDDRLAVVAQGMDYLAYEGTRWFEGKTWVQDDNGCVSCHHVGNALWAHREAQRAGIHGRDVAMADLGRRAAEFLADGDNAAVVSSTLMILADAHSENDLTVLRDNQTEDGAWNARGQFKFQQRGEAEGDAVASLWALAAIATLTDDALAEPRDRALTWLDQAPTGVSTEWTAARLVVAHAYDDDKAASAARDQLLQAQGEDGGWSFMPGDDSSAFATGQVVYALALENHDTSRTAVDNGVAYLLRTHEPDGTWATPSAAVSETASKRRDYIYRYWGTAWATMALARSL